MPSATSTPAFSLFTSMRYDPRLIGYGPNNGYAGDPSKGSPLYMFRLHRDRMMLAASHFEWPAAVSKLSDLGKLETLVLAEVAKHEATQSAATTGRPLKLKLIITAHGELTTQCTPSAAVSLLALFPRSLSPVYTTDSEQFTIPNAPWPVALDPHKTSTSEYTRWKTTRREMYDSARARVGIASPAAAQEVLLQNEAGELIEGSYTSCFFFRAGEWVTPPVASGGQQGTTRRWALENGLCVERVVPAASLRDGEGVWVTNGVKGCIWGRVTLTPHPVAPPAATASTTNTKPVDGHASAEPATTTTIPIGESSMTRKISAESSGSGSAGRSSADFNTREWLSAVSGHQNSGRSFGEVKSVWKDWILS